MYVKAGTASIMTHESAHMITCGMTFPICATQRNAKWQHANAYLC